MGPTWGPSGADRTQVGPMLAPWTLLSGYICLKHLWKQWRPSTRTVAETPGCHNTWISTQTMPNHLRRFTLHARWLIIQEVWDDIAQARITHLIPFTPPQRWRVVHQVHGLSQPLLTLLHLMICCTAQNVTINLSLANDDSQQIADLTNTQQFLWPIFKLIHVPIDVHFFFRSICIQMIITRQIGNGKVQLICPGPWSNIKMSYQYRKSHCGDKRVIRWSYYHNGIFFIPVRWFLYIEAAPCIWYMSYLNCF